MQVRRALLSCNFPNSFGQSDIPALIPYKSKGEKRNLSYRVDYAEPITSLVQRLEREHRDVEPKLERVLELAAEGNIRVAQSILLAVRTEILRHAVEEEAVLVREIMAKAKDRADESVKIFQQHRYVAHFLNQVLPELTTMPAEKASAEMENFVQEFREHHVREEGVAFPLAIKVSA